MKMLKRAGAFAIAGAMALSLGTVSTFAASPITVGDITYSELVDAENVGTGVYQIKVPFTVAEGTTMDQATLLAEVGTKDVTVDGTFADTLDASTTTVYIDQEANDGEFVIYADASRFVADATNKNIYLNVKIGGTGVSEAAIGSEVMDTYEAPVEDDIITSEMVIAALEKDSSDVTYTNVYGLTNAAIMRLDVSDLIANQKLDLTVQNVTVDDVPAVFTVYNNITKLVTLVDSTKASHEVVINDDGASTQLIYGDVTLDGGAPTAADISAVINMIATKATAETFADVKNLAADTNGSGDLGAADISGVIDQVATKGVSIPVVEQ